DLAAWNSRVYLKRSLIALQVIEMSDPENPILLGQYPEIDSSTRLAATDNHLFITRIEHPNFMVYDVADPGSIFEIGYHQTTFSPDDILIDGDRALLTTQGTGLTVFDISVCSPCLADTNGDGDLSPADFSAWVAAFNSQAPKCDQNG